MTSKLPPIDLTAGAVVLASRVNYDVELDYQSVYDQLQEVRLGERSYLFLWNSGLIVNAWTGETKLANAKLLRSLQAEEKDDKRQLRKAWTDYESLKPVPFNLKRYRQQQRENESY